jgi:hypothetical protein
MSAEETDDEFDLFLDAIDRALTEQFGPNHQAILAGDGSGVIRAFQWGNE